MRKTVAHNLTIRPTTLNRTYGWKSRAAVRLGLITSFILILRSTLVSQVVNTNTSQVASNAVMLQRVFRVETNAFVLMRKSLATTNRLPDIQVLRRYLENKGVDISSPKESLFYTYGERTLLVRSTTEKVQRIEEILDDLKQSDGRRSDGDGASPTASPRSERYVVVSGELTIYETTRFAQGVESVKRMTQNPTLRWPAKSFRCVFGTNEWRLDGDFSRNATIRWLFDGTNITKIGDFNKNATQEEMAGLSLEEANSIPTLNVYSTPGEYLPGDVPANICWLAFCSGNYLKQPGRIIPLPVPNVFIQNAPDAFAYADRSETFADALGLPRSVELFTSKDLYEASVSEFWKYHKPPDNKALLKSDVPDGTRKFVYTVTSSTNYLGWNLPLSFEFSEDLPNLFSRMLKTFSETCVVTSIEEGTKPKSLIDSSRQVTVADHRFKDGDQRLNGIMYSWGNNFIPSTNDPRLQAELKASIDRIADAHGK